MRKPIVFIDTEIGIEDKKIHDIGALHDNGRIFHSASVVNFASFIRGTVYLCGHNIINHDLKYLTVINDEIKHHKYIDTLYLSPLLFPKRPYHSLLKDDKLQVDELNNPINDCQKARQLFEDEISAFSVLPTNRKQIFCCLLYAFPEFRGFFEYLGVIPFNYNIEKIIRSEYQGYFCENADIGLLIKHYPIELAYALALIGTSDYHSVTPPWLLYNFPKIENVVKFLRNTPCKNGCKYCQNTLDVKKGLLEYFGYKEFRTYGGEPLQEKAARAAVEGKSLIAVFPTGGGKSITFQLPALMAGQATHGLTVIISPLQSLMKDQVDNLVANGIETAVTINGLLNPVERADAIERVANGTATLLYISPEQLRSRTIKKLLTSRNIVRFVIDEAHCFSAWGQDFRVDYLYIGDFIRELQKIKKSKSPVPVSCFTATAKQKVISDIRDYFKRKLDYDLELFATSSSRENLHYTVLFKETPEEKYITLRNLIAAKNCPTIVYVSRTKRTKEIAEKLSKDGFPALPFNGKMDSAEKIANQESFIRNEVKIIVATSAFGMGVDKKDVRLVIHYDISDSLENYVQEAGRAGRDPSLEAECYVLYNDSDLDKHFILLNQTKLSISEIQQVWKAIKDLTKTRNNVCCSTLEIARQAGWDETFSTEIDTRVKTAIAALENAGYIIRGMNVPHVFASGIRAKNMQEAANRIDASTLFSPSQRMEAKRIIKSLISSRSISNAGNEDAESRVDVLADILGMEKANVINCINIMRQEGLLADTRDLTAYISQANTQNSATRTLEKFAKLERFILSSIPENGIEVNLKEINANAINAGIVQSSVKSIRTILYYLSIKGYIQKRENGATQLTTISLSIEKSALIRKFELRIELCRFIISHLYEIASECKSDASKKPVEFSEIALLNAYLETPKFDYGNNTSLSDIEAALLYLQKIGSVQLEGGFLVSYNGMEIKRIVTDNKIRYKVDDYRLLDEFYKQKIQQIHIVGEYANLMVRDYHAALQFVQDYFQMDFKLFISKYFKGSRAKEINRNITPDKYNQLFGELSDIQSKIINDAESKYIVVAAGPGSGKTRVLVHKLAALLLLEDVKHEQLLMVTFSRAAATEFKKRLIDLIGNAAHFVDIKTFHSYCFDLLGKIGNLEGSKNVVHDAGELIRAGEVEPGKIIKRVLVIDEAQDMDADSFNLVQALMQANDDMRVIAVGDDDQNIYAFRGSDSKYLKSLITENGAIKYEMVENYRSRANIVSLANAFALSLKNRMKTAPNIAIDKENGSVQIIRYNCRHMEKAVVDDVIATYHGGVACVLTNTNDEALQIMGLLLHQGKPAKLIQSLDGFSLYHLVEIREFLHFIDDASHTSVIPDDVWNDAKKHIMQQYRGSLCLENISNLFEDFEKTNVKKYRSDLEDYIRESSYEDFYRNDYDTIFVSTIHKAKGREFDAVYLMLNNTQCSTDEERRKVYVGMTRAKETLHIHINTTLFDQFNIPFVIRRSDFHQYDEPLEISLHLSHHDVVLDYFKSRNQRTLHLRSGDKLFYDDGYLSAELNNRTVRVAKLSKACMEKLTRLSRKGYSVVSAKTRFVVMWKGEHDEDETAIPDCEIIRDLLPLYIDDAASDASRQAVEAHVAQCPSCTAFLESLKNEELESAVFEEKEGVLSGQEKRFKRKSALAGSVIAGIFMIPILVCLIVNLASGNGLTWFFIVLAALLTASSLTVVPLMMPKNKGLWTLGTFTLSLLLLFGVCCLYTGGKWFFTASFAVLFGMSMVFAPFAAKAEPAARLLKNRKGLAVMIADTALFAAMMLAIGLKNGTPGFFRLSAAVSLPFILLAWILFVIIRYGGHNRWLKAGLCVWVCGLFAFFAESLINGLAGVKVPLYRLASFRFDSLSADSIMWLILFAAILLGAVFAVTGILTRRKNK